MTPLPSQPPLREHEGLPGFIGRLAAANGLQAKHLLADIGIPGYPKNRGDTRLLYPKDGVLLELAALTGRAPGELKAHTAWPWELATHRLLSPGRPNIGTLLRPLWTASCTACPPDHVPLAAHNGLLVGCPEHERLLLQTCPQCRTAEPIDPLAAGSPGCRTCGRSLAMVAAPDTGTIDRLTPTLTALERLPLNDPGWHRVCDLLLAVQRCWPDTIEAFSTEPFVPADEGTNRLRQLVAWTPLYLPEAWEIASEGPFADRLLLRLAVFADLHAGRLAEDLVARIRLARDRLCPHGVGSVRNLRLRAIPALGLTPQDITAPIDQLAAALIDTVTFQDLLAEVMGGWPVADEWQEAMTALFQACLSPRAEAGSVRTRHLALELAQATEAHGRVWMFADALAEAQRTAVPRLRTTANQAEQEALQQARRNS